MHRVLVAIAPRGYEVVIGPVHADVAILHSLAPRYPHLARRLTETVPVGSTADSALYFNRFNPPGGVLFWKTIKAI
jgi:hypothetical protein